MTSPKKALLLVAGLVALVAVGWLLLGGEAVRAPVGEVLPDPVGDTGEIGRDEISASPFGVEPAVVALDAPAPRDAGEEEQGGPTRSEIGELSEQVTVRIRCEEFGESVAGVSVTVTRVLPAKDQVVFTNRRSGDSPIPTSTERLVNLSWASRAAAEVEGAGDLKVMADAEGWLLSSSMTGEDGWVE